MRIKLGELRKIIKETLDETRPWGREVGAEWDEPDGGWFDNVLSKAKAVAMTDLGGPEGFLSPADRIHKNAGPKKGPSDEFKKWQEKRNKKQEVSETGAYYGKTAPARGVVLGGNDQEDPKMVSACGDPSCNGCEYDPPEYDEPPVMCWCGDRDCSHYE